jgi:uncharacterized membrane protein HdeD (DUF308 family)
MASKLAAIIMIVLGIFSLAKPAEKVVSLVTVKMERINNE